MRKPPPEVVGSWPDPNYVDPESRGPALLILQLITLPLAIMVLLARLYVRIFKVKRSGPDDWLMVAATVFCVGLSSCVILATQRYGWRIHIWDVTPAQAEKGRQASIAAQTIYLFATGLAKMSILVSYLRITPLDSWFRRLTCWSLVLVGVLIPVFLVVLWTQCIPANHYWEAIDGPGCIPEGPPLLAQAASSVITDFLLYVLPLPTLVKLRLPVGQRVALLFVFSLGFVVVLAGSLRTYWAHRVVEETYDVTWDGYKLWIWTGVEANLAILCGCLPMLRPLFRRDRRTQSQAPQARVNLNIMDANLGDGGRRRPKQEEKSGSESSREGGKRGQWVPLWLRRWGRWTADRRSWDLRSNLVEFRNLEDARQGSSHRREEGHEVLDGDVEEETPCTSSHREVAKAGT